jgi:integrase/recombinase XerC
MELTDLRAGHLLHLQSLARLRRRPATLTIYRVYVGMFLRFLEERGISNGPDALNPRNVGDFQDWHRAHSTGSRDGASAERMAVRLLKSFSRWLWRRSYLGHDPLERLQTPNLPKIHRAPFSEIEVRSLVGAARRGREPDLHRALLLLGLDTGSRIGELCGLELDDLDLEGGYVIFRLTKGGRPRRVFFGVPSQLRGGPCAVALRLWLERRPAQAGVKSLFTNAEGYPLSTDQARGIYRQLGIVAGVPNCIPHRGRHTHASELLAEMPGAEIQLRHRLGHLSKDVLADYVSVSDRSAREIAGVASLSVKWNL